MEEKWLLVLGAKSDIAKAVAHKFADNGFNIYLSARSHIDLENDAKDIEIRHGVKAKTLEFDALKFSSHRHFYESLNNKPVGVICAVGYLGTQKKAEQDLVEAQRIISTNFTGCVSILNEIVNDFENKKRGFVIGISSVAGDRGRQSNYLYGSAKAGFTAYLSGLRNRLSRSNVRVITVKPGFVFTAMTKDFNLPKVLTAQPKEVADDIFRAWKNGKDVIYVKWFWKYIMSIIRLIPEKLFKKLTL